MNRNILPGVAGVAVVVITAACSSGVSTTPSGHTSSTAKASTSAKASASPSAKAATVGDSFTVKDSAGNTYRVTLVKVIDPAKGANQFTTPDNGKRFVGAVFTVTAVNGSPKNENADLAASVTGSNGQSYQADFNEIAGYTNFNHGEITVAEGQSVTGAVTFQVPDGVKVTRVLWGSLGGFGGTVQWSVP